MLPAQSGIYCIEHADSGRVYVGSALNMRGRVELHIRLLSAGNHHSPILQRSWVKYGSDAFDIYVLEIVPDHNRLSTAEQMWIDRLQAVGKNGFNIMPTASRHGSGKGTPASPKYRQRCCNECGQPYQPGRADQFFCVRKCRMDFENRMMTRGRELYSLFMVMRYERGVARMRGVWAIACRLAQGWREEDERERDGRQSWIPAKRALAKFPVTMTVADVYVKQEKFGRAGVR